MLQNKVSKMIILAAVLLLFSFLFSSCGDDDNPTKPVVTQGLNTVGGFYYKAVMGATNNITFTLGAADKSPISGSWVQFSIILGDGTFVIDSVKTDVNGKAVCQYNFDGVLGHAEIQALVRNIDTTTVTVRANTLIPGATGQGQFILMEDRYSDIKNFNGTPIQVDPDPYSWGLYAVYESTLGVVFIMEDINRDSTLTDTSNVLGIIVNTVYTGKTKDSLCIGSTLAEVFSVYSDSVVAFDPSPPAAYSYKYPLEGITFWVGIDGAIIDREVFEIHLIENIATSPPIPSMKSKDGSLPNPSEILYKRYGK